MSICANATCDKPSGERMYCSPRCAKQTRHRRESARKRADRQAWRAEKDHHRWVTAWLCRPWTQHRRNA